MDDETLSNQLHAAHRALRSDRTIDIITTGARTGRQRTTEIWFTNIAGRIIICGTPSSDAGRGVLQRRDWLANLKRHPGFLFRFKESVDLTLPATAAVIHDPKDRRAVMSAAETAWYRNQGFSVDELVAGSPIVSVLFSAPFETLNVGRDPDRDVSTT